MMVIEIKTIKREQIIKRVAGKTRNEIALVRDIYNAVEESVIEAIVETEKCKEDTQIKLFNGLCIRSAFFPETKKRNNFTGEIETVKSRIRVKAEISRRFKENINSVNN